MKRRVVEWIIFIILYLLSERAFISSSEAAVHDIKPLMKEKQLKNVFKNHETSFKGLHEAVYLKDIQREKKVIVDHNKKGKGSYGGGDLLRPRSKKSGSNSLLLKSTSLYSSPLLRFVLLGLLLTTMFFF